MAALQGWRVILLINLASIGLLAIGILAGQALPHGLHTHGPGIDGQMLAWDGTWYRNIAQRGYQWNAAFGTTLGQHQNIAFFPLYALTDWTSMHVTGSARPIFDILPGLGFGLCANAVFYRLARHLTTRPAFATALFAFWPASCFYAMGYPTGLLNVCVILCFHEYTVSRRWRAAFWCGLGTAAAPSAAFVAAALSVMAARDWWRAGRTPSALPGLAGFGALCVSGLLVFMAYQAIRFGDPLAFSAAQRGFTRTPPFFTHVLLVFDPFWYAIGPQWALAAIQNSLHHALLATPYGREVANAAFQLVFDLIVLAAWIILLTMAWRQPALRAIALAGWFIIIGYLWFLATTDKSFTNGIRMLYPALAAFLVIARLTIKPPLASLLLAAFALLTILETALVAAGYTVI